MKPYSMYRNILLSDEIGAASIAPVITKIMDINYDDDLKEQDIRDWKREPIYLFINSNGGNAYDAFALVDVIKCSKTPVYTVALGWCMSAGFLIFLAGHKRLIGENATLMFHAVATWIEDKTAGIQQELVECQRLTDNYCNMITSVSMVKQETLDDYITRKAEWYIPASEAVRLKLAEGYYKGE